MKILKKVLTVIVILIAVLLITALFVKKEYTVQREVTINKPANEVFAYVTHLKNQVNYSKWVMQDPKSYSNFKGEDGTVGFVAGWNSDDSKVGEGEQEIKALQGDKRMDVEVRFVRPFAGKADTYMITEPINAKTTKVKWSFSSRMPYPMNIMSLVFNPEKMLGDDINISLNNLKAVLEK
jgi:hypothetical protein